MTWDVILHILQGFGLCCAQRSSFERGEVLLLLGPGAADRPNTVYVTTDTACSQVFHRALVVSVGPCPVQAENRIELEQGDLIRVFNALADVKNQIDTLDSTLALCETDQAAVDQASSTLGIPMFYLDDSYRILAITRVPAYQDDAEWIHMTEKGYLSPQNARRMKEAGDLDLLASAKGPVVYRSNIYPFPSVVSNVWLDGKFVSRLNLLCVDGDTSPLRVRACEIIIAHLNRILSRSGKLLSDGPLQSMLIDLLRGIRLSEELISDRLKSVPHLSGSLLQLFYVNLETKKDQQLATYYASLLTRQYPEESFIPVVFERQLVLLAYASDEPGFNSLIVKLSHFFSIHHLHCGVSNRFRRLSDLRGYYDQALSALTTQGEEGLNFYRDIMLEHVLSHIPTEQARFLISPDIFRLQDANTHYSFSLVETLKAYLDCNCNLIRTAERLFLHKNTLLYRLNHIRSIIRCDLNDADERLLLMLSFKLLERLDH